MQKSFSNEIKKPLDDIQVFSIEDKIEGEILLKKGKVALVVLAGGMGSRLGSKKPKGLFEISNIQNKTLFQILLEKVFFAEKKYKTQFYISVMLSNNNKKETIDYLEKNSFFGLKKDQIDFIIQEDLPFLDEDKKPLIFNNKEIKGPNGNGDVFNLLKKLDILKKYKNKNIDYLNVVSIDNPISDPVNPYLIGALKRYDLDIAAIAIKRTDEKKSGVFVKEKDQIKIVEYIDLLNEEIERFKYLNANLFCFKRAFLEENEFTLPLHRAEKNIVLEEKGGKVSKKVFKIEKFLFDIFSYTKKIGVFLLEKNICFSPLKDKSSIEKVKRALYQRDRDILKEFLKKDFDNMLFELSFEFYYPNENTYKKLNKKHLNIEGYIEL